MGMASSGTPASVTATHVTPYSGLSLSKLAAATASTNSAGSAGRSEKVGAPSVTNAPSLSQMAAARIQAQAHVRAVASVTAQGASGQGIDIVALKNQRSKAAAAAAGGGGGGGGVLGEAFGAEQKPDTRRVSDV
jgi:hypothetical protein